MALKHRGLEYNVVQGLGRQLWKWGFVLAGTVVTGQAATKAEAVAEAERAIERALTPKKLKLVRPEGERERKDPSRVGQHSGRGFLLEVRAHEDVARSGPTRPSP